MDTFPLSQTGLARNRGLTWPRAVRPERIQILHRKGVAPKMDGVFELEVHAWRRANPVLP
jgi:hypothetical protein